MAEEKQDRIGGELWLVLAAFTGMYGLECLVAYGGTRGWVDGWYLGKPFMLSGMAFAILGVIFEINKRRKR